MITFKEKITSNIFSVSLAETNISAGVASTLGRWTAP
jgi:hypothetical protein